MIRNPRDEGPPDEQDGGRPDDDRRAPGPMSAPRPWMGLRDPRIVRVSRSLGGKDRHSKVTTIRGLRDRRVRLSVSTALQLYDLQDRLGLSQPSKAVDWLLNAAQHEIDKLPPLQFPPGGFIQCPPSIAAPNGTDPHEPISGPTMPEEMELTEENGSGSLTLLPRDHNMGEQTGVHNSTQWSSELPLRARWTENTRGAMDEKEGFLRRLIEQEHHGEEVHSTVVHVHPSTSSMAGNNNSYASYYYNLEGTSICLSRVGGYVMSQAEENGHCSQQLLLCPSAMPPQMFSSHAAGLPADYDPKRVKGFHLGSS